MSLVTENSQESYKVLLTSSISEITCTIPYMLFKIFK